MSDKWNKSQKYEEQYLESKINQWNIPFSEKYWLDFMQIDFVALPALEVGCGNFGMWRFNNSVTGLDPLNFSKLGSNFIQAKAEHIPYKNDCFRDVYCINALDHAEDPRQSMLEMTRVCSDRLVVWCYIFNKLTRPLLSVAYKPHPHSLTLDDFIEHGALVPDFMNIEKLKFISPSKEFLKYTKQFIPRAKIQIAELLGMEGLLLHLRKVN